MSSPDAHVPKASVIIPSFNHARYLPDTIESVLRQTMSELELLIVDDGSKDNSLEVAEKLAATDKRVRVLTHPGHANRGIGKTANLGLEQSRGRFVSWLGSDDQWKPQLLERQIRELEHKPQLSFVHGYTDLIDADGKVTALRDGIPPVRRLDPLEVLIRRNDVRALTVVVRREAIDKVGAFDEQIVNNDYELWLRLSSYSLGGFVPESLAFYRIHPANISGAHHTLSVHIRRQRDVYAAISRKIPGIGGALAEPRHLAHIELQSCYLAFCDGDEPAAQEHWRKALVADPHLLSNIGFLKRWLVATRLAREQPLAAGARDMSFQHWFLENLPPAAGAVRARLARTVAALSTLPAFAAAMGNGNGAWSAAWRLISNDSSLLVEEPYLRKLMFRSLIGGRIVTSVKGILNPLKRGAKNPTAA